MTTKKRGEDDLVLRFGGGVNSRASEEEINDRECASGENFILDPENSLFRPRPPFDLIGTVPNAAEIRGFVTLLKTDGSVSMLVQAGDTVYEWDGGTAFTSRGTVAATAQLRGTMNSQWQLTDTVLITDLNLQQGVMTWDGTTLATVTFIDGDGFTPFGTFRAKYCAVENERALFANVLDQSGALPNLMVGSKRGDFTIISNSDRPSSALSAGDPFFIPHPENRAINGMVQAFNVVALSGVQGGMYYLTGDSEQDFKLDDLYHRSGADGTEPMVSTGNDIVYGRQGRIESLIDTQRFGNVESDDLTFKIADQIETYDDWTLVYNERFRRIYCISAGENNIWVAQAQFLRTALSPWSKWTTQHPLSFQPTAVLNCLDPADGLEYTFMGDSSGNLFRLEGSGANGDGGTTGVVSTRLSKMFIAPMDAKNFRLSGWLKYRKNLSNTFGITIEYAGEHVHDVNISLDLSAAEFSTSYNGAVYYSGDFYYGTKFFGRLVRRTFGVAGSSNEFQIRSVVESPNTFDAAEIGLRFDQAT